MAIRFSTSLRFAQVHEIDDGAIVKNEHGAALFATDITADAYTWAANYVSFNDPHLDIILEG